MIRLVKPSVPKMSELIPAYRESLESGMLTNAKHVAEFERQTGVFLGNPNTIAVSHATTGLLLAFKLLKLKGEVILPSFTFSSTGHVLLWNGIKPVFADIDPETFNLDPADVEKKITKQTSAIMPVHCFGNPAEVEKFEKLAKKYKLKLIYDAAHAFGSTHKGKSMAQFGDVAVYSFTPTKAFTTGEGGLIVTRNSDLVRPFKLGRNNGESLNLDEEFLGVTARMAEFNAILGLANLKNFHQNLKKRQTASKYYRKLLGGVPGIKFQKIKDGDYSALKDFTITLPSQKLRDGLLAHLKSQNIESRVYFLTPLHQRKVYEKISKGAKLPNTEWLASHVMSLPFYTTIPKKDIATVCRTIKKYLTLTK